MSTCCSQNAYGVRFHSLTVVELNFQFYPRENTRALGRVRKTEHTVHEMKAICMEFTVVGREKGLHSEEKEEGEEEACREKEGLHR